MSKQQPSIISIRAKWLQSLPATSRWAWVCLVIHAQESMRKNPNKSIRWPTDRKWESWAVSPGSITPMTRMAILEHSLILDDDRGCYKIKGLRSTMPDRLSKPQSTESTSALSHHLEDSKPSEGKHGIEISMIEASMPRRCTGLRKIIKTTIAALEMAGEKNPIEYIMVMVLVWRMSKNGKRGVFAMHPKSFMDWIIEDRDHPPRLCDTENIPFFA